MTPSCKKPGVAFWATLPVVVLLALLTYPLSIGPAQWICEHGWVSENTQMALESFYWPVTWLYDHGPEFIRRALAWYGSFWR
jgi:hypothetical protein